jgi:hypothetical protein
MFCGTVFKVDFFSGINVKIIRPNIKYFIKQLPKIQKPYFRFPTLVAEVNQEKSSALKSSAMHRPVCGRNGADVDSGKISANVVVQITPFPAKHDFLIR